MPVLFCVSLILTGRACAACSEVEKSVQSPPLLEQFVGVWRGDGRAGGKETRDVVNWEWALDHCFLKFSYKTVVGDNFKAEGYMSIESTENRLDIYEFNNGEWPVRRFSADIQKLAATSPGQNRDLVLDEITGDRHVRLVFAWMSQDSFRMTESYVRNKRLEEFVRVTFHRESPREK